MNKYLLTALMLVTAFVSKAEYDQLVFQTAAGSDRVIGLTNLCITFADGKMTAISDGEEVVIDLLNLKSMEFNNSSGIAENFAADTLSAGSVTVYSAAGQIAGTFTSVEDAYKHLTEGVYIFKTDNGVTFKMIINR